MSAEILRRAATRLREGALAATPGPWTVETLTHGDSDWVMWNVLGQTDENAVTPIPLQTRTEDAGNYSQAEADVSYAALVHPPVALALADWLEHSADDFGGDEAHNDHALAVAREVLREPEGGEVAATSEHWNCRAVMLAAAGNIPDGAEVDVTAVDPCDPDVSSGKCPHGVRFWIVPSAGERASWGAS